MKKFLHILLIVCTLLFITGCSNEDITEKTAHERANFYFGVDKTVDMLIQLEAQAEGWKYIDQNHNHELIKTGVTEVPFITTFEYCFENPNNEKHIRYLSKTYIFDNQYWDWVPLVETVSEINDGNFKKISSTKLWQGGYSTPFFKE